MSPNLDLGLGLSSVRASNVRSSRRLPYTNLASVGMSRTPAAADYDLGGMLPRLDRARVYGGGEGGGRCWGNVARSSLHCTGTCIEMSMWELYTSPLSPTPTSIPFLGISWSNPLAFCIALTLCLTLCRVAIVRCPWLALLQLACS